MATSEFPNDEALRLHYLHTLGISSWYPRYILPGARPSVSCPWEEAPAQRAQAAPTASPAEAGAEAVPAPGGHAGAQTPRSPGAGRSGKLSALLADETPAPAPAAPAVAQPATAAEPMSASQAGAEPALQFRLCLLAAAPLAVCVQVPTLARQPLGKAEHTLLQNILRWLGQPLAGDVGMREFAWPLPGMEQAGDALAGRSLFGFLQQAWQETGFSQLLFMGSSAADTLTDYQHDRAEGSQHWQLTTTHALNEMLAMPDLKRTVYQQLLPLHALLSGGRA